MVRKLSAAVAVLLLLLIVAAVAVLKWPGLLLNDRTLEVARSYLGKHGIADLTWRKGTIHVDSESLLRKRLHIALDGVCYQRPDVVRACFESVRADALVDLSHLPPGLAEVGPVQADGGTFQLLPIPLSGTATVKGGKVSRLEQLELGVKANAALNSGSVHARALVEGTANLHQLRARLTGDARGIVPGGSPLKVKNCDVSTTRIKTGGHLRLDCPVSSDLPSELREGKWRALGLPEETSVQVTADLETASFLPDPSERVTGRVEARIAPLVTKIYELAGGATVAVDAVPLELPSKGKLDAKADLRLGISQFERLARRLDGGPWAIWAPLHNLAGRLDLAASGDIDLSGGSVPIKLITRLKSPAQKLNIDAEGKVELGGLRGRTTTKANVDVLLSDVQLELPRLDLAAPPRLLPDSRVAEAAPKQRAGTAPEGPSFEYSIHIHTPGDHAAMILSNLARAPVPVGVDLMLESDQPVAGSIAVRSFPVKFFNRVATIDHFNLKLKTPQSESPIDGMVRIDLTDYQFRVLATGTIGKPGFTLESDPPLSQNQILAVLIYGRAPDELDAEESSTVGSTEAAIRDQAIGLASFFLLGSTPVEGLAYDPKTRALTVRFHVAEGTSLNLGASTGDLQEIGIRRRLGKDWSITTDVTKGTGDTSVLSAFLEWAHRY